MKKEEKRPIPWEIRDPRPPVVKSGHGENLRQYENRFGGEMQNPMC